MDNQEYEQKKQECWEDFCRHIVDEEEEFYNMFDRAYSLGKQENDMEDTVIQGWVAIDEAYNECYLHTNKPTHEVRPIADTGDYESHWGSEEQTYLLDADLFPDMDSNSEPQECEIIIKRKKKWKYWKAQIPVEA